MPSRYLTKTLLQTATYWAPSAKDGYGGYTFATPVTLDCRWLLKQELFIDTKGKEKVSAAVVLLGQDVSLGGYLYLGASTESNPKDADSSFEIRGFAKIPDIKGTSFLRKAWL